MGVVYSAEKLRALGSEGQAPASSSSSEVSLQPAAVNSATLVACYLRFQYAPMMDSIGLHSFFMNARRAGLTQQAQEAETSSVLLLWKLFQVHSICYVQEVLACLIMLSGDSWHVRLGLLFDALKGAGCSEISHDDIVLAAQVVGMALHRLWQAGRWEQEVWGPLCESVADGAFAKLEKELDEGISREDFVNWASERFKESRSVATPIALEQLYSSGFE